MADNPQLSAGTADGVVISGDDVTVSGHSGAGVVQYVKLVDGTANGTQPIHVGGGTQANALRVTVATDSTGVLTVDNGGTFATQATLQTGANAIGKLAANSGVDIGDVDILSIAAGDNNIGNVDIVSGTITTVTTITNDVSIDDGGNSITVDSGAAFTVQEDGAALTALQLIDDIVSVDDTTVHATGTTKGANIMAAATPTDGSVAANDIGMVAMSTDRRLHVDADITASVALDASAATLTVNAHAVTNAGTFVVQEDGAALTALQLIDNSIVAHDAAISGATGVSVVGARAVASVEGQTETAAADASQINVTLSGNVITQSQVAPEELVSFYVANTDGAEDAVTGLDAGGATIFNYITAVTVHNAHATTQGFVTLLDGSGGSVFWPIPAPATGGATLHFSPPLKQPTVNTALYVDVSAAITTMHIGIAGYQGQG